MIKEKKSSQVLLPLSPLGQGQVVVAEERRPVAKGEPSPALLVLRPPGDLRNGGRGLSDGRPCPAGCGVVALGLVLGHGSGVRRRMDVKRASGVATTEHRGHAQVGGQATSARVSQGALLRHLGGQVGAYAGWVGVDQDSDPDYSASLVVETEGGRVRW